MRQIMRTWKKCEVHSLERKKGRMVHVAQDFFGSGNDTRISWRTGRIGGSTKWRNGKEAGNFDWHDQKKQYTNYKMNTRAYADLLQCCTQDIVSFGIVDTAKDKDLMNGNTALAWKRLFDKFAGCNNAEKMKLIKQLNESRMKKWWPWRMDYEFGTSTTKNCRMWKDNQW